MTSLNIEEQEYQKNRDRFEIKQKIREINKEVAGYLQENGLTKPNLLKPIDDETLAFEGGYGRIGIIWIDRQMCVCCKNRKECLVVDQSEGEYNQASVCFDCIDLLRKVRT